MMQNSTDNLIEMEKVGLFKWYLDLKSTVAHKGHHFE